VRDGLNVLGVRGVDRHGIERLDPPRIFVIGTSDMDKAEGNQENKRDTLCKVRRNDNV